MVTSDGWSWRWTTLDWECSKGHCWHVVGALSVLADLPAQVGRPALNLMPTGWVPRWKKREDEEGRQHMPAMSTVQSLPVVITSELLQVFQQRVRGAALQKAIRSSSSNEDCITGPSVCIHISTYWTEMLPGFMNLQHAALWDYFTSILYNHTPINWLYSSITLTHLIYVQNKNWKNVYQNVNDEVIFWYIFGLCFIQFIFFCKEHPLLLVTFVYYSHMCM